MAKHGAYPIFLAIFLSNLSANSAESLIETSSIFNENTPFFQPVQPYSFREEEKSYDGDSSSYTEADPLPDLSDEDCFVADILTGLSTKRQKTSDSVSDITETSINLSPVRPQSKPRLPLTPVSARNHHHQQWCTSLELSQPDTAQEHKKLFQESIIPGVYHSPIKVGTNNYYFLKGVSPTKTPRGKRNLRLLESGKTPVLWDRKTGEPIRCEMHHVGQENGDTDIVMLPRTVHKGKHALFHTETGASKINRSRFETDKKHARKALARKFDDIR